MSKITSIVGMLLIIAAGALAAFSSTKEDVIKSKKEISTKYLKDAEAALSQKDFTKALKFAKLAIKADPDNKAGYNMLIKITEAQCSGDVVTDKKVEKKPAAKEAEEEELGC